MKVTFMTRFSCTSELLAGSSGQDDQYLRITTTGREDLIRGRVSQVEAGDEVELSEQQVDLVKRDSPGAIAND